jgi:glycosyltransferase involved in cell wall biosynthesis
VKQVKIAFLVPYLTRSQVTRAFPFARMLCQGHEVSIFGSSDPGEDFYCSDPRIGMDSTSGCCFLSKAIRTLSLIRDAEVVVVCKPVLDNAIAAMAVAGRSRLVFDLDDDDVEMIRLELKGWSAFRKMLGWAKIIAVSAMFRLAKVADATMVASRYLQEKYGGSLMPVPVDLEYLRRALEHPEAHRPAGHPLIVFVGIVRRHKGITELVEAFPMVKSVFQGARLLIAGSTSFGRYPREIMRTARGISRDIVFTGYLDQLSLWQLMANADVLVCPNPDTPVHRAQTPIKVMEYMATGRPIVATPVGGARDILEGGELGTLSRSDSPEDIAESILWVLRNPGPALGAAERARKAIEERYSFEAARPLVEKLILGTGRE